MRSVASFVVFCSLKYPTLEAIPGVVAFVASFVVFCSLKIEQQRQRTSLSKKLTARGPLSQPTGSYIVDSMSVAA